MADPFDLSQLQGLLAQFQPTDADKTAARQAMLAQIGFGLLGTRKGQEWDRLSYALQNGSQAKQQALASSGQQRRQAMQDAGGAMDMMGKISGMKSAQQDASALSGIFGGGPDLSRMGEGGPTEANAAAVAPNKVDQYRKAAAYYAQRGNVEAATKFSNIADKMEEEYSTTPQVVRGADGKLQLVQFGKRGGTKTADGMTPAEKLHFGSTGGTTNVGFDPYTGAPVSPGMPATMTPDQVAGNEQWRADHQLRVNADRRAAASAGAAKEVKPQLVDGQFVYPPDAQNPGGRTVPVAGFTPKAPEHTRRELDTIDAQLGIVRGAREAAKTTPTAFSMRRGLATMAGTIPESIASRTDSPKERETRAYVYNVVSSAINERAGAAQSAQELSRLRSFLPAETDNATQVQDKLTAFETYLTDKRKAYSGAGGKIAAPQTIDFSALPK